MTFDAKIDYLLVEYYAEINHELHELHELHEF